MGHRTYLPRRDARALDTSRYRSIPTLDRSLILRCPKPVDNAVAPGNGSAQSCLIATHKRYDSRVANGNQKGRGRLRIACDKGGGSVSGNVIRSRRFPAIFWHRRYPRASTPWIDIQVDLARRLMNLA
jgi:hypothetical protein